jgi:hypothetical protein
VAACLFLVSPNNISSSLVRFFLTSISNFHFLSSTIDSLLVSLLLSIYQSLLPVISYQYPGRLSYTHILLSFPTFIMFVQLSTVISILSISSLVSAHGKVASVTGDAGGNGTALGILGGVVPGAGSNDVTEIDTTVFKKRKIATNGLGRTMNGGKNKAKMVHAAMAQSGDTLPQVSDGGYVTGSFHIVTTVSDIRVWNRRLD